MTRQTLMFTGPRQVEIHEGAAPQPAADEVLVQTAYTAISAGTEMLVYRDQFPQDMPVDAAITGMGSEFAYPLAYGYIAVGEVVACGADVASNWVGRQVFAFQPHTSHFTTRPEELHIIPPDLPSQEALFAPNMETAVNLVQDGQPLLGERVLVIGQGIVGLLVTALLSRFPLQALVTLDHYAMRRQMALAAGAGRNLASLDDDVPPFDLIFEVSGNPAALDIALEATGFGSRVVIGSWYGQKQAPLALGGAFHRNRVQLISSQVSTIAPALRGRWDKARRFALTWEMLRQVVPYQQAWVTHEFPIGAAADAYHLLDTKPETAIQVILSYPH